MNTDPFDDRIRALVSHAVSASPPAPSLATRQRVPAPPARRGALWAGVGIAACLAAVGALVWSSGDDEHTLVGASTSSSPSTAPAQPWPVGVAALVASSRGIERVEDENGQAVVTRLLDGVAVARAIQLEDGGIVFQETGGDIRYLAPDGNVAETPLVTDDGSGSTVLDDADAANGELRLVFRTPTTDPAASFDLGVWFQPDEPRYTLPPGGFGVGYGRFTIVNDYSVIAATIDDTGNRGSFGVTFRNGQGETSRDTYDSPVAMAGDGAGSVGWVTQDGRFTTSGVRSGSQPAVATGLKVTELDWRGQWLLVTQDGGLAATLVDLVTETRYQVPVSDGVVTLSRYAVPSTQPVPTTTVAQSTTSSVVDGSWPPVVTAGADGVWEYGSAGALQWTAEPMAFAVRAPDGSMIMQRMSGGYAGAGWSAADTLPLRQASPGAPVEDLFGALLPAADVVAGFYTVHDAATVGGRDLLLLDRQTVDQNGLETPPGALLVVDLAAGSIEQIGDIGGWEEGSSRLHLATTGLIVGERYAGASRELFSTSVDGVTSLSPAGLGLEVGYFDCNDCPRLYTVSRDGGVVAWLDGTHLVRRAASGDDILLPLVELGDAALSATDVSLGDGYVVLDGGPAAAPLVFSLDDQPVAAYPGLPLATRAAIP